MAVWACRKNSKADQPAILEPVMRFDSCACSTNASKPLEDDYISAEIDGVPMCFDVAPPGLPDTFSHHMRYGYIGRDTGDQYFDNVYMIKNSTDGKWQIAFFLENTHALDRQFPYSLPRPDPYYCEIGELQLISQEHFSPCSECAGTNTYSYYSQFWTNYNVKMTVTSFDNNIFEGVFSGNIFSRAAKPAKITNGKFRVRLITYYQYIDL
jgi:hypothetical protein